MCVGDDNDEEDHHKDMLVHQQQQHLNTMLFQLHIQDTYTKQDGELIAIDPTAQEEAAAIGSLTILATPQGEVCGAYKVQGIPLGVANVLRCVRVATAGAEEVVEVVRTALKQHEVARVAARVRRRLPAQASTGILY